jgi:hypothetical protein
MMMKGLKVALSKHLPLLRLPSSLSLSSRLYPAPLFPFPSPSPLLIQALATSSSPAPTIPPLPLVMGLGAMAAVATAAATTTTMGVGTGKKGAPMITTTITTYMIMLASSLPTTSPAKDGCPLTGGTAARILLPGLCCCTGTPTASAPTTWSTLSGEGCRALPVKSALFSPPRYLPFLPSVTPPVLYDITHCHCDSICNVSNHYTTFL